ncbi:MAG: hypothetical protein R3B70_35610 [Polyangiaceae bacterium]
MSGRGQSPRHLGFSAFVSLAAATPLAATIGAVTGASSARRRRALRSRGRDALEALRHLRTSILALGASWAVLALVAFPVGHLVLRVQPRAPRHPRSPAPVLGSRAASSLPTLVLIGLTALVASAVLGALVWIPGASVTRALWPSGASHDLARRILTALVVLVVLLVGVIHDLARAAAVTFPAKTYAAPAPRSSLAWRFPVVAPWSWAWRMFIGVLALAGFSWLGLESASAPWQPSSRRRSYASARPRRDGLDAPLLARARSPPGVDRSGPQRRVGGRCRLGER